MLPRSPVVALDHVERDDPLRDRGKPVFRLDNTSGSVPELSLCLFLSTYQPNPFRLSYFPFDGSSISSQAARRANRGRVTLIRPA